MVSATLFMACFSKCKDGFITQILQKNVAFFALILQKNRKSEG